MDTMTLNADTTTQQLTFTNPFDLMWKDDPEMVKLRSDYDNGLLDNKEEENTINQFSFDNMWKDDPEMVKLRSDYDNGLLDKEVVTERLWEKDGDNIILNPDLMGEVKVNKKGTDPVLEAIARGEYKVNRRDIDPFYIPSPQEVKDTYNPTGILGFLSKIGRENINRPTEPNNQQYFEYEDD